MRKLYITLAAIFLAATTVLGQKKEYTGNISVRPVEFEQKGDSLYVGIKFDMQGVKVKPTTAITYTPAIVAMGHNEQLPSVMVMGRNSFNMYRRQITLMSKKERAEFYQTAPYAVVKAASKKKSSSVDYELVMPYELWMADSRLDLQQYISGCLSNPQLLGVTQLSNGVLLEKPYEIKPQLAYITPEVEAVKRREVAAEAFLDFVVNKTNIDPAYMNNPRELAKITDMISVTRNDPAVTVRSISVIGYASPEGSLANNKRLSEGRANALVGYLVPRFDFPREYYKVMFGGENWEGLRKIVETSEVQAKTEIINIIDRQIADVDGKSNAALKKQLMNLQGGAPYRFMLKEYYPSLRKAICKVEYVVKGFELDEAKEVIKTKPQNLSMNEMYLVANTYTAGSEDFVDVFETAVKMFPLDETANVNAAAAALSRNDTVSAEKYLAKVKTETAEYNNAMGVLNMINGNYEKAEKYLNAAASQGLEVAKANLSELAIKMKEAAKLQKLQNR